MTPDEATAIRLGRLENDTTGLWREKASRREVDQLAVTVRGQGETLDEKADKSDVREIREDLGSLRRAIIVGSIAISVSAVGSALGYILATAGGHP